MAVIKYSVIDNISNNKKILLDTLKILIYCKFDLYAVAQKLQ